MIKCKDCNNKAVIIEDKKYYCADCYIKLKNIPTKEETYERTTANTNI
jgi:hypothetical protein